MNALLTSLFAYKAWANAELLSRLGQIPADKQNAEWTQAVRIVNHTHVVDNIFKGHLLGEPHGYTGTNTTETPTLTELQASTATTDAWYQSYVAGLTDAQAGETIRFTFTDGDKGCMTRGEILMHVITHGGYHRGAAGQILKGLGGLAPRDSLSVFWHRTEPQRRTV